VSRTLETAGIQPHYQPLSMRIRGGSPFRSGEVGFRRDFFGDSGGRGSRAANLNDRS
jgi:hypothetical protein